MAFPVPQSGSVYELSQKLESTDGVAYLTADVVEDTGYLVIAAGTSNEERVKYTSKGSNLVSGLVRGLSSVGASETAGTGNTHSAGTTVEMKNVHYYFARPIQAINGVSTTGADDFVIGSGDGAISAQGNTFYNIVTSANNQFQIGLSTNGFAVWTDDGGSSYNRLSATGGAINSGLAWENAGGTGNVKVSALISATAGISSIDDKFSVNLAFDPMWTGDHDFNGSVIKDSTVLSASFADINQMVSGVSAYSQVTAFRMDDLTNDGQISTANNHYHFFIAGLSSRTNGSTGTQDISFTPAFTPRLFTVDFYTALPSGLSDGKGYATDDSTEGCTFVRGAAFRTPFQDSSNIMQMEDSGGDIAIANVSVMSAGRITLDWTTNSSASNERFYTYQIFG